MTNLSLQEQTLYEKMLSQKQAVPRGAGTRLPRDAGALWPVDAVSTVAEYHPEDLVVTVGASMRLLELAQVLDANHQWHALMLPDQGQDSLGGVIALGLEGWFRTPLFRDRILGMRAITPAFGPISTGAKVVKSVAGYNLPRLLLGSRGGLGVITEITLRVSPKPPIQQIWVHEVTDPQQSLGAFLRCGVPWASLAFLRQSDSMVLTAVWSGSQELDSFVEQLGHPTEASLLPRLESHAQGYLTYGAVPIGQALALLNSWPRKQPVFLESTTGGFWGYVADAAEAGRVRQRARDLGGMASTPFLRPAVPPAPWWKTLKQSFDPDGCLWDPWQ